MTKFEDAMTKKQYTIYRLWHPTTPGIRYVGLTTLPLIQRLVRHLNDLNPYYYRLKDSNFKNTTHPGGDTNNAKCQWFLSLLEKGLAPHINALETHYGTFAEAREIEDDWMMHYLGAYGNHSFTLLNAKLPKQTQTLVKGEPSVTDKDYEQDNKNSVITESFGPFGYVNYDATLDRFQGTVYISPNRQLASPLPNYFTLACDNEK